MAAEGAKLATGWLELAVSTKGAQKTIVDDLGGTAGKQAGDRFGKGMLGAAAKIAAPLAAALGIGKVIATGFDEVKDAAAVTSQLEAGVRSTGNAANVSVDGMNNLAASIQGLTGQTDDSIAGAQSLLLTFTNVRNVGADKIFDDATRAAADMAARLGGDATSKARLLGKALNDPVKGLSALTRVGVTFTDQQKEQVKALVESGDTLGAQSLILDQINTKFGDSAEAFGKTLPGQVERAKRGFEDFSQTAIGAITPLAGPVLELLISGMARATEFIAPLASQVGPAIASVFGQIGTVAEPLIAALAPAFGQIVPVIASLLPPLLELWQAFSPLSLILRVLTPILPQLVSMFGQLGSIVAGVLGSAVQSILPVIIQVADVLTGALSTAFAALMPAIESLIPVIVQVVGILAGTFQSVLQALMPIIGLVADLLASLVPIILPLITSILGLVEPLGSLLVAISPLIGALLPPLIQLLGALLTPILGLIEPILGLLVPAIQVLVDILGVVIQWVADGISWLIRLVTGNQQAGAELRSVWDGVMQFFAGIGGFFADIWNGLVDGVANMVGSIGDWFASIPDMIGDFFAGAGEWLYNAGRDIINGLLNGAGSLLSNIGSFFLDMLPDFIREPFKAALGINSPSTVFFGYGENIVDGAVGGVKARKSKLQDEMTALATVRAPRVAGSAIGSLAALAASGGVTIHGDVHTQDLDEFAELMERNRRRSAARVGAGVGGVVSE